MTEMSNPQNQKPSNSKILIFIPFRRIRIEVFLNLNKSGGGGTQKHLPREIVNRRIIEINHEKQFNLMWQMISADEQIVEMGLSRCARVWN